MKKKNPFPEFHRKAWEQHKKDSNRKRARIVGATLFTFLMLIGAFILGSVFTPDTIAGATGCVAASGIMLAPGMFNRNFGFNLDQRGLMFNGGGGGTETPEQKKAREESEFIDRVKAQVLGLEALKNLEGFGAKVTELENMVKALKPGATDDEYKALKKMCEDMGLEVKALKEKEGGLQMSQKEQVANWLKENKDKISQIQKSGQGLIELELKTVGDMTTGSGTIVGSVPQYPIYGNPTFNLIGTFIDTLVSLSSTNSPNYPYTELEPKDGDYSFLGEGDTKPQIDFLWKTRYATPYKAAAWERLTTEVVQDVARMESLANDLLRRKHDIKRQRAIISGSGTGDEPKGLTEFGRAFVAGAMANTVDAPNIMDVINACIVDIRTTHNYQDEAPYAANVVMMNDIDYFIHIQTPKDGFGRPLFMVDPVLNSAFVGTVRIIPTPEVEQGNILVCDATKMNVANYIPYTVKVGWINDDFIKNQFVILGESRFYAYVKKLDEQAFIYDDIETIKAAIKTAS